MYYRLIRRRRFNETVHNWRFKNGFDVWLVERKEYHQKCVLLLFDYGSLYVHFSVGGRTKELPYGVAHLLEHRLFEKEDGSIFDELAEYGAEGNAFTSYSATGYHFQTTDRFYRCLRLLLSAVQRLWLDEKAVEREKEIIICEIKDSQESPEWLLHKGLIESLYRNHPVRVDIAGTVESVKKISPSDLDYAHSFFYRPDRAILVAAGDIDREKFASVVSDAVSGWRKGTAIRLILPREPATTVKEVRRRCDMERHKVAIGYKDTRLPSGRELVRHIFAAEIAATAIFGHSSENYQRLYLDGVIDDSFSALYVADRYFGHFLISGDTDVPDEFIRKIKGIIKRSRREGFEKDDFERIKRRTLGAMLAKLDSLTQTVSLLASGRLFGHFYLDTLRELEKLSVDDAVSVLREVATEKHCSVSVVSPR